MDDLSKNQIFAIHGVAAAGSVAMATALTYPLDTIKVITQVGSSSGKKLTADQVLRRVQSLSGNTGLFSGFGWLAFGRVLGLGARFGVYEILTAFYKDGREDNYVYVSEALMAGMVAGATETLVSSPFELIKLRAQVNSASFVPPGSTLQKGAGVPLITRLLNGSGKPPSVYHVRRPSDIISLEGWGTFWRGFRSGVARDSVFGGVFFSSWQFLHRSLLDWKAVGMDPEPRSDEEIGPLSPLAVSLSAGFSASIAAAASHSFDTARSRSQCTVIPKYVSMERKLLKWRLPGNRFERTTGIHPSDRNLLSRGIWLRMARSGFASFFIVGSYLSAVDHFASNLT
ncbi:solute carrier family 25 member 41 [Senna tora]|uniref:Solute carrier family 25 member 41 n=1 Tax=Senna tora TaxID=362788 RepID=A0A835CGX7_9FABA|nr:solute carrier family 25 member 41 [Senna tora]